MKKLDRQQITVSVQEEALETLTRQAKYTFRDIPHQINKQYNLHLIAEAWKINHLGRGAIVNKGNVDLHMARTDRFDRDILPFLESLQAELELSQEPDIEVQIQYIVVRYYTPGFLGLYFFLPTNGSCTIIEEKTPVTETRTTRRVVCR